MNLKCTSFLIFSLFVSLIHLKGQCSANAAGCPAEVTSLQEMTNCVASGSDITMIDNYDETITCNYDLSGITFTLGKGVDIRFDGNITVSNTTEFDSENGNHSITINGVEISNSGDLNISELNAALLALTGPSTLASVISLLPVEFISFQGKATNKKVRLEWATATESNNSHFEVQHSLNGKEFKKIKEIKGAGTTQIRQDYSYEHRQAVGGVNYYRLKQIDYDGQFEYSTVISVDVKAPKVRYSLFPNPVRDHFVIETDNQDTPSHVQLFNQIGQEIRIDYTSAKEVSLPAGLKSGFYVLRFELNGQVHSEKLLIQ